MKTDKVMKTEKNDVSGIVTNTAVNAKIGEN